MTKPCDNPNHEQRESCIESSIGLSGEKVSIFLCQACLDRALNDLYLSDDDGGWMRAFAIKKFHEAQEFE